MDKAARKPVKKPHMVSVIIPTMKRETLQRAVQSVRNQWVPHEILVRYDPDVNEYVSRTRALKDALGDIIAFLDDDAMYRHDTLAKVLPYFDQGYGYVQGICKVQGRDFAYPATGVGTATFILKEALEKISFRFDIVGSEPRGTTGRGWRADSMLLYDFMEKFGENRYIMAQDVIVEHPEEMKGFFNPDIEEKFYTEYKKYVDRFIYPIDPRLQQLVAQRGLRVKNNMRSV